MQLATEGLTDQPAGWSRLIARIDQLSHPSAKNHFVEAIVATKGNREMLQRFARQYHYFSVMQASLIPALIQCFEPTDLRALAELSQILADEYGNGKEHAVHSEVFKTFAKAMGVDPTTLPIDPDRVVSGIRAYLDGIRDAYASRQLPRVLAAYTFLERSAVHSYAPLLAALREVQIDEEDLKFFPLHVELEPEHAETAINFVKTRLTTQADLETFAAEIEAFGARWEKFWTDLDDVASRASH